MNKLPTASPTSSPAKLDLMLDRLAAQASQSGRLVFALDATMSRQETWDRACQLQAEMFNEATSIGSLEIQVVYFRGESECRASSWMTDGKRLSQVMARVECVGGYTQIAKVLRHARQTHDKTPVAALVFVGDATEESIDALCAGARELGNRGIKAFMFQEGDEEDAEKAFRQIADLTHGAYCKFSPEAARELGDLLRAVAAYAAGGLKALGNVKAAAAVKLLEQIKK
jgi:hypothetical protein